MPIDTRRINGPESSSSYLDFLSKSAFKAISAKSNQSDRKQDEEHRSLFLRTGIVSKAKGSAYIEQGQTEAICAVYGPREIPRRSDFSMKGVLNCVLEHTPFSRKVRRPPGESKEEELSIALGEALEATVCMHLYPKSQIDVYVTILEDDGSTLAAALTVSGLALADAAVQMFDTLVGASLVRSSNDRVVIDPTTAEEDYNQVDVEESKGQITIGYQPSLEQIALMNQEGNMSTEHLMQDTKRLAKICSELVTNVHLCLVESIKSQSSAKE